MHPPKMSGAQLWAEITEMPRPYRVIDFPRKRQDGTPIGKVAIWVLTQEERIRAAANAERTARVLLGDEDNRRAFDAGDVYENAAALEILYRACRDVNDVERPAFPSVEAIGQAMTVDEVASLLRSYTTVQAEIGPIVSHMSERDVEAWIERLTEAGNTLPLDLLAPPMHADLTMRLARRLARSPTVTSLPGSLAGDGKPKAERGEA